jgi:tRNA (cmo5U34)-methyltransferase
MKIPTNWTFQNKDVADGFENHVREQLPWYDLATFTVAQIARHYIPENGTVLDLGASTGNIARAIEQTLHDRSADLIAIERSKEMCDLYQGAGTLHCANLQSFDFPKFNVAIGFLTLMFLPVDERKLVLEQLLLKAKSGGAIILFDRMEAATGYAATALWRLTLSGKVKAGAPAQEIIEKELSLAGVQRPIARYEYPADAIEIFRFGDFAGWLIEVK